MRVGVLGPIAWRTPPDHYGPWEQVVATLTEALIDLDVDVTLFATGDSVTRAELRSVVERGYEVDHSYDVKVFEALHIANCFERATQFDVIHNHFDFLPLAWSGLVDTPIVTTIHGFSSEGILPAYERFDGRVHYVAISDADRHPRLHYAATIHHGLDLTQFTFRPQPDPDGHLLSFGRIHPDKATHRAVQIALAADRPLTIAGIIHDEAYFRQFIEPHLGTTVEYVGSIGRAERPGVLGAAAGLLHPVAFAEPFGLSTIEALACGTPVIATRRGAMGEIVRPGVNGFLVETNDDAVRAAHRLDMIDRRACRTDAEQRFSARRMAEAYLDVYQRVAGTG